MSLLKRFTTSMYARVDRLFSGIENHDALVEAAIRDSRARVAGGKARLERLRRDGEQLQAKVAQQRNEEERWAERAKALAAEDEAKALECLRRRKLCHEQRLRLQEDAAKHADMLVELERTVRAAEEALQRQLNRYHLMRGRESAAAAQQAVDQLSGDLGGDLEAIFERWEARVLEAQTGADGCRLNGSDRFEREFAAAEAEAALRAELHVLRETKE